MPDEKPNLQLSGSTLLDIHFRRSKQQKEQRLPDDKLEIYYNELPAGFDTWLSFLGHLSKKLSREALLEGTKIRYRDGNTGPVMEYYSHDVFRYAMADFMKMMDRCDRKEVSAAYVAYRKADNANASILQLFDNLLNFTR